MSTLAQRDDQPRNGRAPDRTPSRRTAGERWGRWGVSLPPFPVDDDVLDRIEEAMNTRLDGENRPVGGEFTLPRLLDFYSGYDPTKEIEIDEHISEYPDPLYHRDDVISALIAEVRRLRSTDG